MANLKSSLSRRGPTEQYFNSVFAKLFFVNQSNIKTDQKKIVLIYVNIEPASVQFQ